MVVVPVMEMSLCAAKTDFCVISCFEDFSTFLPINFPHFACQPILNLSNRHQHYWTDVIYFHALNASSMSLRLFKDLSRPTKEGDFVGNVSAITAAATRQTTSKISI